MANGKVALDADGDLTVGDEKFPGAGGVHRIGQYIGTPTISEFTIGAESLVVDVIRYVPILIPRKVTYDAIQFNVSTLQAASNTKVALYKSSGNLAEPGVLLEESGNLDTSTTGLKTFNFGSARVLDPGIYYLAIWTDTASVGVGQIPSSANKMVLGYTDAADSQGITGYTQALAFAGSFPDPAVEDGAVSGAIALIRMKRSA